MANHRRNASGPRGWPAVKIAVLFGGTSEERDVSIASAAQIIPALRSLGHQVFAIDSAAGRLSLAQERQLLSAAVAPAPPSDREIARVLSQFEFDMLERSK